MLLLPPARHRPLPVRRRPHAAARRRPSPALADGATPTGAEKRTQLRLLDGITERAAPVGEVWVHTDDRED
ncbi:hypothetical protein ACH41E_20755 [Streptomyces sp. NPDC020412]|uniref:hypothetical protein n=1 Tax=Streptomyces sp. NPDC020412 TaxID=3365073 RepID=UPI0037BA62AE